jgi:L-threonylcarbamoyladenylate synthase
MKYTHYSPDAPLYILSGTDGEIVDFMRKNAASGGKNSVGFLCFEEMLKYFNGGENIISIGPRDNLEAQAKNLFNALNKFNALGVEIIYSVEPVREKLGEAIYNRLIKAAGGKVLEL